MQWRQRLRNGMHSSDNETRLNKKKPRPPTCDMIKRVTTVSMKISFVLRNPRNLGGRDVTRISIARIARPINKR